jgi:hypothetical protein
MRFWVRYLIGGTIIIPPALLFLMVFEMKEIRDAVKEDIVVAGAFLILALIIWWAICIFFLRGSRFDNPDN